LSSFVNFNESLNYEVYRAMDDRREIKACCFLDEGTQTCVNGFQSRKSPNDQYQEMMVRMFIVQ